MLHAPQIEIRSTLIIHWVSIPSQFLVQSLDEIKSATSDIFRFVRYWYSKTESLNSFDTHSFTKWFNPHRIATERVLRFPWVDIAYRVISQFQSWTIFVRPAPKPQMHPFAAGCFLWGWSRRDQWMFAFCSWFIFNGQNDNGHWIMRGNAYSQQRNEVRSMILTVRSTNRYLWIAEYWLFEQSSPRKIWESFQSRKGMKQSRQWTGSYRAEDRYRPQCVPLDSNCGYSWLSLRTGSCTLRNHSIWWWLRESRRPWVCVEGCSTLLSRKDGEQTATITVL